MLMAPLRTPGFLLLAAIASLGCHDATNPFARSGQVVVGVIDAGRMLPGVIQAPTIASIGEVVTVTVSTFGNSCVEPVNAQVTIRDLEAVVTPYDREYTYEHAVCIDYLKAYPRSVAVAFPRAGRATIRVQGRSFYKSGLVAVEHPLTIEP